MSLKKKLKKRLWKAGKFYGVKQKKRRPVRREFPAAPKNGPVPLTPEVQAESRAEFVDWMRQTQPEIMQDVEDEMAAEEPYAPTFDDLVDYDENGELSGVNDLAGLDGWWSKARKKIKKAVTGVVTAVAPPAGAALALAQKEYDKKKAAEKAKKAAAVKAQANQVVENMDRADAGQPPVKTDYTKPLLITGAVLGLAYLLGKRR